VTEGTWWVIGLAVSDLWARRAVPSWLVNPRLVINGLDQVLAGLGL